MKLAISNIAWPPAARRDAYAAMKRAGVSGLEVAPGLLFAGTPDPFNPDAEAVRVATAEIDESGLELVSAQSLLYGVEGAQLFGRPDEQKAFHAAMVRAIDFASRLSIPNIVFGSPKNRLRPDGLSCDTAIDAALPAFRALGDYAARNGVTIALEPVPASFGANFLTDFTSVLEAVHRIGHPAVRLNFDIGALHTAGEFPRLAAWLDRSLDVISHVHVSEAGLLPAPADAETAGIILGALSATGYGGWISIEMRQPDPFDLCIIEDRLHCLSAAASAHEGGPA